MAISLVRVPAKWEYCYSESYKPVYNVAVAEFKLGLGPCGKVVRSIYATIDAAGVRVIQHCEDGERKTFFYPMHTLTGRVEIIENNS